MLLEMQPEYPYSLVGIMEIIRIPTCDMVFRGSVAPNAGSRLCGVAGVCENEGIWPQFWGHIFCIHFCVLVFVFPFVWIMMSLHGNVYISLVC